MARNFIEVLFWVMDLALPAHTPFLIFIHVDLQYCPFICSHISACKRTRLQSLHE